MEDLTARTHESTSISVLDEEMVVYVARVAAKRIMTVGINVGTRFPAYATSMGRVLLAHAPKGWLADYLSRVNLVATTSHTVTTRKQLEKALDAVRRNGYSLVDQELEVGLRSLAVPIHDAAGTVIAAMNSSTHVRFGTAQDVVAELLPQLQKTAAAIEADLRVRPDRSSAERNGEEDSADRPGSRRDQPRHGSTPRRASPLNRFSDSCPSWPRTSSDRSRSQVEWVSDPEET